MLKNIIIALIGTVLVVNTVKADNLSVAGGGGTNLKTHNSSVGLNLTYGLAVTTNFEARLSQGFGFANAQGTKFTGDTSVGVRYYVPVAKSVKPYAGVSAGALYGDTSLTWNAGPEAGVRFFVNNRVFVDAGASYQFVLTGRTVEKTDSILYKIAVGWTF